MRQLSPSLVLLSSCSTASQSPAAENQEGHRQLLWCCAGLAPLPSPLLLTELSYNLSHSQPSCSTRGWVQHLALAWKENGLHPSLEVWLCGLHSRWRVATPPTSPVMADSSSLQKLFCPFCSEAAELFLPSESIADLTFPVTSPETAGQSRFFDSLHTGHALLSLFLSA